MKSLPGQAVFVDPSGRRRRHARHVGLLIATPAAGYLLLLVSTVLGGPSLSTPLVPIPDAVRPPAARHTVDPKQDGNPTTAPTQAESSTPASPDPSTPSTPSSPSDPATPDASQASTPPGPLASGTPTAPATVPPATTVPASTQPAVVPTPTHPTQANNSTAPGRSHSPTAKPSHTPKNP